MAQLCLGGAQVVSTNKVSLLNCVLCFEQGEDICVALQTHINDVMLRRYSRTRNVPNAQLPNGVDITGLPNVKPPGIEVYEKHVEEMSKLLDESQRKIDQASGVPITWFHVFNLELLKWNKEVVSNNIVKVLRFLRETLGGGCRLNY